VSTSVGTPAGAATALAARGWSVVPVHTVDDEGRCSCRRADCPSPGKHPRVRWEPYTEAAATSGQVAAWWRRWPAANVGVVTGTVSGVAVVDVDPRHGGHHTLAGLAGRWGGVPETVETLTGGGGRHLWFTIDGPLASAVLGPGLELKADGGTVVVPPSRHLSGRRYQWRPGHSPDEHDLAPFPRPIEAPPPHLRAEHRPDEPPIRTTVEQDEFAEAWVRAGVDLVPGDHYYRCPFHDDHQPSLHVDAEGCRWYCFGCREGGGTGRLLHLLGEHPVIRRRRRLTGPVGAVRRVTLAGDREVGAVGESLCQDALLELSGGVRSYGGVDLEAVADLLVSSDDPTNVEVRIEGRRVGWLARDEAVRSAGVIAAAQEHSGEVSCRAGIRGGWDRGGDDVGMFGVVLYL
jgi:hypothetical protein